MFTELFVTDVKYTIILCILEDFKFGDPGSLRGNRSRLLSFIKYQFYISCKTRCL